MDFAINTLSKLALFSFRRKLSFFGGFFGIICMLRWLLGRNIPTLPDIPPRSLNDVAFLKQLFKLIPIAIPSFRSKEALYAYTLSSLLILRSFLSIFVSSLNGKLLKALVTDNKQAFIRRVFLN